MSLNVETSQKPPGMVVPPLASSAGARNTTHTASGPGWPSSAPALIAEGGGAAGALQRRKRVRDVIPEAQEGLEGASSPRGKWGDRQPLGRGSGRHQRKAFAASSFGQREPKPRGLRMLLGSLCNHL